MLKVIEYLLYFLIDNYVQVFLVFLQISLFFILILIILQIVYSSYLYINEEKIRINEFLDRLFHISFNSTYYSLIETYVFFIIFLSFKLIIASLIWFITIPGLIYFMILIFIKMYIKTKKENKLWKSVIFEELERFMYKY